MTRLPRLRYILYAVGNFGKSSLSSFIDIYALFYLTDRLALPASIAGFILLTVFVWDAVLNPLTGFIADRLRHHYRTVSLYFLIGVPVTALSFVALFYAGQVHFIPTIVYVSMALIFYRTAYTFVDVPHNSLLFFLSKRSTDRTTIAGMRIFFSAMGKLMVTLVMVHMLGNRHSTASEEIFGQAAQWLALVYLVLMALTFWGVRDVPLPASSPVGIRRAWRNSGQAIIDNRNLTTILVLSGINSLVIPMIGIALVYVSKYGLNNETAGSQAVMFLALAQAASLFFWTWYSNHKRQKRRPLQMAYILLAVSCLTAVIGMTSVLVMYLLAVLAGFAIGGIFMLNWAMLPNALDKGSSASAKGHELSIFGLYTFINKSCHGLSQACVGLILTLFGYDKGQAIIVSHIGDIRVWILILPVLGSVLCLVILQLFSKRQQIL